MSIKCLVQKYITLYFKLSMLFVPLLMHTSGSIKKLIIFMVLFSLLGLIINEHKVDWLYPEKIIIFLFFVFFSIHFVDFIVHEGALRELDTPSRMFIFVPLYIFIRKLEISPYWLIVGFIFAGFFIGLNEIALKHYPENFHLKILSTSYHSGEAAFFASIFGITSLLLIHHARSFWLNAFLTITALICIYVSYFYGGRGAWVAAFLTTSLVVILNPLRWAIIYRFTFLVLLVVSFAFSYFFKLAKVDERINNLSKNTISWFEDGKVRSSSAGQRLELWKSAFLISKDNIIFGIGENSFKEYKKVLIDEGKINEGVSKFNHPHSEYLSVLVEQGIFGLIFLLFFLLYPIFMICKFTRTKIDLSAKSLKTFLLVILFHYLFYGIANGVFDHQSTTLFFAFYVLAGLGLLRHSLGANQ